jgi:hypothetical protein
LLPAIAQRLRSDFLDGATHCFAPKDKRQRHERNCQT